jgi:uncharacterized membrane protein
MVCLTVMLILPSASPLSFYEKEALVSLQRLFSVCVCVCVCVCSCQFFHLNYLFLHSDLNTLASSCCSFACCICNALSIIVCLFVNYLSAILLKLALSTNQSNTQSFLSWYSLFFLELRLLISPLENSKLPFIVF